MTQIFQVALETIKTLTNLACSWARCLGDSDSCLCGSLAVTWGVVLTTESKPTYKYKVLRMPSQASGEDLTW